MIKRDIKSILAKHERLQKGIKASEMQRYEIFAKDRRKNGKIETEIKHFGPS